MKLRSDDLDARGEMRALNRNQGKKSETQIQHHEKARQFGRLILVTSS